MLKDVSHIRNREQQDNWSASRKRRRKNSSESGTTSYSGSDTINLSYPARHMAFFKNVDFNHSKKEGQLFFELAASRKDCHMVLEGSIDINTFHWELTWTVESDKKYTDENEMIKVFYNTVISKVNKTDTKEMNFLLNLSQTADSGESNLYEILKDLLNFIQTLLPVSPPLKTGIYSPSNSYDSLNNNSSTLWPNCFNRKKADKLQLKWINKD